MTSLNTTAITVTWLAPWPQPVDHYVLTIANDGGQPITVTTSSMSHIITKRGTASECEQVEANVTAVTTIGKSPPSAVVTAGFIRGTQRIVVCVFML